MTDKTRDKLLLAIAVMVHDLADNSPVGLCSRQEDKEALWTAITEATAEHHICGNCARHSLGAGPSDIYCEAQKAVFPKEASCSIWTPTKPKTSRKQ